VYGVRSIVSLAESWERDSNHAESRLPRLCGITSSDILENWEQMGLRQSTEEPHLGYFERIPAPALRKAGINSVGLDYRWWHATNRTELEPFIAFGMDYGLQLYDIQRVLFQDFVVGLIKVYWKRDKEGEISAKRLIAKAFYFNNVRAMRCVTALRNDQGV
jgi:hypothetical protein